MNKQIQIAGLVLAIDSDGCRWDWEDSYRPFAVQARPEDVLVRVHWQAFDGQDLGEELASIAKAVSESASSCRVFRRGGGSWAIETDDLGHAAFARRVAVLSGDWSRGDLYVELKTPSLPPASSPLCPPLDRVLVANLLARRSGMLLHACGVVYRGQGYLFTGPSGAGKTTLARLWSEWDDTTVLGEECLAVRSRGSEFVVYGTPWIGESRACSSQGAPLAGIYFLHHAGENLVHPTPAKKVVEGLLARSFVPTYDAVTTLQVLDFCARLAQAVPAYDFGFRPDAGAVEFIREARLSTADRHAER